MLVTFNKLHAKVTLQSKLCIWDKELELQYVFGLTNYVHWMGL